MTTHTSRNGKHNMHSRRSSSRLFFLLLPIFLGAAGFILLQAMAADVHAAPGEINGTVFRDFDSNGAQDTLEPGVISITVSAYDDSGFVISTTTNITGEYSLSGLSDSTPYRIEVTGLPTYLQPSASGSDNGTTTQVATSPQDNVDIALQNPADYCQENPNLALSCFTYGDQSLGIDAFVDFPYTAGAGVDATVAQYDNPTSHAISVLDTTIGSTYGVAYHRASGSYFAGAFIKRHSGLGALGSESTGAIYRIDSSGTPTLFADLNSLFGSTTAGSNPHPNATANFDRDVSSFDAVGKAGFGDLEISEDGQTLFAMNLADRSLYALPVANPPVSPSAGNVTSYTVPTNLPGATNSCFASDVRPFGLGVQDGLVYVGMVCTGESSATVDTYTDQNSNGRYEVGEPLIDNDGNGSYNHGDARSLFAYVYTFDLATNTYSTAPVLEFPLNYLRESSNSAVTGPYLSNWQSWGNDYYQGIFDGVNVIFPQPILSDIEFDGNDLMIGLRDRFGDQSGTAARTTNLSDNNLYYPNSVGDILRACKTPSGWVIENNGQCGDKTTTGGNANSGPGGREYYYEDSFGVGAYRDQHSEVMLGSLVMVPGTPEVAATVFDPALITSADAEHFDSSGVRWLNNNTGVATRAYRLIDSDWPNIQPFFGKASSLGDLEAACLPAPLEIGNYVWQDDDGNGVQDPSENGINGVTVELYDDGGNQIATAQTIGGEYYFINADDPRLSTIFSVTVPANYGVVPTTTVPGGLVPSTDYQIRVDLSDPNLSSLSVSTQDYSSDSGNTDLHDSDGDNGVLNSGFSTIEVTTGAAGANDHTLDFGFAPPPDAGDLPDTFDTTAANGGPTHSLSSDLYLGSCVDSEADGAPDNEAGVDGSGGDDSASGVNTLGTCAAAGDDEDGITLITPLIPGNEACISVTAVNTSGSAANLYGFIDFNGDGDFDSDTAERLDGGTNGTTFSSGIASIPASGGVANAAYCFDVPSSATFDGGETHMRFRLTSDTLTGNTWAGTASDGEVEDYYTPLACVGNYLWFDTGATANQQDGSDAAVSDGTAVNLVWGGANGLIGSGGDDLTYSTATTGGTYSFCGLPVDANGDSSADQYQVVVPASPGTPVTADQGGDDALDSDGSANGAASEGPVFTLAIPNSVNDNAANDLDPNNYPDNQTDLIYDFGFTPSTTDYGDLPDTFDTTTANSGPNHALDANLYLGSCVDAEADGSPDPEAGVDGTGGDDSSAGSNTQGSCSAAGDDEDGITLITPLIAGSEACLSVTAVNSTGSAANLYGFIDFNGDGDFDSDTDEPLNGGTSGITFSGGVASVANGGVTDATYCFDVPSGATFDGGETHLRFRLTSDTLTGNTWAGAASDGEVEDYFQPLACVGNLVFADTGSTAGTQDGTDVGLNGLTLNLVWGGPDGDLATAGDNETYTTVSSQISGVDGKYQFCGLTSGAYRVDVPTAPASHGFVTAPNDGSTDLDDSDGSQPTGYGGAVSGPEFMIAAPTYGGGSYFGLPTSESSTGDTPGALNNYPDGSDDLTFDFGFVNTASQDWGDLPDSYGTTAGNNGAAHTISGPYLGSCVDAETTGYPSATATNEDNSAAAPGGTTGTCSSSNDDEDGVTPTDNWSDGTAEISVVASAAGCFNLWVDFTDGTAAGADGDFNDTLSTIDEHVIENQAVSAGNNALTFSLPASVADSQSFAIRARLTAEDGGGGCAGAEAYGGTASSAGDASSGEVEDYIISFGPTAVTISQIGGANDLNTPALFLMMLLAGLSGALLLMGLHKRQRSIF